MRFDGSLDRRDFLRAGALGFGALGISPGLWATGLRRPDRAAGNSVLVVVQLSGGNDGLNTVVPYAADEYHRARPGLGIKAADCLRLDDIVGLNGRLGRLKRLFDEGKLAIVQGVGYPGPDRSHFKSMDIWHSARPGDRPKTTGWLGRLADQLGAGDDDPDLAINLATRTPLALAGEQTRPISFQNPNLYRFVGSDDEMSAYEKLTSGSGDAAEAEVLRLLGRTAATARTSSAEIRTAVAAYETPQDYPRAPLAQSLRNVAALLDAGLSTRIYYTYLGGFDTHTNQTGRHAQLMTQLDQALDAFQRDLERLKVSDRVTVLAFSEFGRRVKQNASGGTDHGTAGPTFVLGGGVRGGLYGTAPSLTDLDRGDLRFTTDFRSIYAELIDDWMGGTAVDVLGEEFQKLRLLNT